MQKLLFILLTLLLNVSYFSSPAMERDKIMLLNTKNQFVDTESLSFSALVGGTFFVWDLKQSPYTLYSIKLPGNHAISHIIKNDHNSVIVVDHTKAIRYVNI